MSTRILAHLIFCFFKILSAPKVLLLRSRITLRYYLDFVTVILTAPSLPTYVVPRAVTEQTHAETPAGKFQCFIMAKIDPVLPFSLIEKSNFAKGKPTRRTKNKPLGCKYLSIYVLFEIGSVNFDGVLQRFPSLYQANSQVCFKWMSKLLCDLNSKKRIWSYTTC